MSKKLILSSAFYSIGSMGGAVLNLAYQFALMIFLTTDDYGIIQPLLQFVGLLILPITAYQFALTKHFSSIDSSILYKEARYFARSLNVWAVIIAVLWLVLIPIFKNIFHVDDTLIFVMLCLSLTMQIFQIPYVSLLQSENRFVIAGIAQIIQGFARIFVGLLIVWKYPTIWGAMTGVLVSNLVFLFGNSYAYNKSIIKNLFTSNFSYKPQSFSYKVLWVSLGSVGLFSLLTYSDTVLVRSFLPEESALFASANLLGKGMIFLTTAVSFIVLPLMANKLNNSKASLWYGFLCLTTLVLGYLGFFWLTSPFISTLLFKNDGGILEQFQKFMPFYNLMFAPYPIIYYFLNYYLVKENPFYPFLLSLGTVSLYVGIYFFHSTIHQVAFVVGVIGYAMLAIVLFHAGFSKDKGMITDERFDETAIEQRTL